MSNAPLRVAALCMLAAGCPVPVSGGGGGNSDEPDLTPAGCATCELDLSSPDDAAPAPADAGARDLGTPPPKRDPLQQPFASTSIWNMPLGSGAVYVPAKLSPTPGVTNPYATMPMGDDEIIVLRPSAPLTELDVSSAGWSGRDRCVATGGPLVKVPMPSDFVVGQGNGNASASFLAADGHTIVQTQPLARCTAGKPGTSLATFPAVDLYGAGITGAHGGSGLSAIGGSLRVGELRPGGPPPRHALKVDVYAKEALYKCTTRSDCFRWPAVTADSYAVGTYGTAGNAPNVAAMKQGSLLALPPSIDLGKMGLETEPGAQLAWTLQNYGAYVVDDTFAPGFALCTESGPDGSFQAQFKKDYGVDFLQKLNHSTPWLRDVQRLIAALAVVDNNGPGTIGGGGTPRQPLAPPIP